MPYAGKIIEDPITKQRITFLKTARDTGGELLRFEMRMAPGTFIPNICIPCSMSASMSSPGSCDS